MKYVYQMKETINVDVTLSSDKQLCELLIKSKKRIEYQLIEISSLTDENLFHCTSHQSSIMLKVGAVMIIIVFFHIGFIASPRGKFKKDGIQSDQSEDQMVNSTHEKIHESVRLLRRQASTVVVVMFAFLTVGMFFCCRYIPEAIMVKCNY